MSQDNKRTPQFYQDQTTGAALARMPLAQAGKFAILDAADMRALMDAGVSLYWTVKLDGYVAVNIPGSGPIPVGRLIVGASKGERVNYKNGDRLDMRSENLRVTHKEDRSVNLAALLELQAEARKARESAKEAAARAALGTAAEQRARIWANLQKDDHA